LDADEPPQQVKSSTRVEQEAKPRHLDDDRRLKSLEIDRTAGSKDDCHDRGWLAAASGVGQMSLEGTSLPTVSVEDAQARIPFDAGQDHQHAV